MPWYERSGTTTLVDDLNVGSQLDPELVAAALQAHRDIAIRAMVGLTLFDKVPVAFVAAPEPRPTARLSLANSITIEVPAGVSPEVLARDWCCDGRLGRLGRWGALVMRSSNEIEYVWLARVPQDFRKGINGLSIVVEEQLAHDPFSGHLFVFINNGRDKIKALYWERSGFCLWQKRQ